VTLMAKSVRLVAKLVTLMDKLVRLVANCHLWLSYSSGIGG
jgi:hypothetical protein